MHVQNHAAIIQYCNASGSGIPVRLVPASELSPCLSFGQQRGGGVGFLSVVICDQLDNVEEDAGVDQEQDDAVAQVGAGGQGL